MTVNLLDEEKLRCLLPKTKELLLDLINNSDFLYKYTFVGGSALSLYLLHRKSEDLDFFTYSEKNFFKDEILLFFSKYSDFKILTDSNKQIDILIEHCKITFFDAKWNFLTPMKVSNFNLAPIESLIAMKVNTLFLRAKFRDYYDLYVLSKKYDLDDIFCIAKSVIPGLTFKLFSSALLYVDDILDDNIDHLEPSERISKLDIRNFFEHKLKNLYRKKEESL